MCKSCVSQIAEGLLERFPPPPGWPRWQVQAAIIAMARRIYAQMQATDRLVERKIDQGHRHGVALVDPFGGRDPVTIELPSPHELPAWANGVEVQALFHKGEFAMSAVQPVREVGEPRVVGGPSPYPLIGVWGTER